MSNIDSWARGIEIWTAKDGALFLRLRPRSEIGSVRDSEAKSVCVLLSHFFNLGGSTEPPRPRQQFYFLSGVIELFLDFALRKLLQTSLPKDNLQFLYNLKSETHLRKITHDYTKYNELTLRAV